MSLKSNNIISDGIHKNIFKIVNYVIKCVEWTFSRRFYINIFLIILSVGLVSGYYFSINDKEYWENTYKTITKETTEKAKIITTTFVVKTQDKFDTSFQQAYTNSMNSINKKSFHHLPKVHIRSKTSMIEMM